MWRCWLPWTFCSALLLLLAGCASESFLQVAATPEEVGLFSQPLKEMSQTLRAKVDAGEIPGAVVLVSRNGKVAWQDAVGWRDRELKVPMTTDSVFRIASMTKPVTTVAVLILVDEGKLRLDDPVSTYLPAFAQLKVGVERTDASGQPQLAEEPAQAPIRIVDLLRHTSGLTYGFTGKSLVRDRYNALDLFDPAQTNAEFAAKLATLPLQYQPGTRWEYGMSFDLLARVVEVVSAMEFSDFVSARILQPLRMDDTGFNVAASAQARVAQPQVVAATGKRPDIRDITKPVRWASGGGGLASTAPDYARFCQMLLNGGTLDGKRILSAESVALMFRDHLPSQLPASNFTRVAEFVPSVDNGNGFGLGGVVRIAEGTNAIPARSATTHGRGRSARISGSTRRTSCSPSSWSRTRSSPSPTPTAASRANPPTARWQSSDWLKRTAPAGTGYAS